MEIRYNYIDCNNLQGKLFITKVAYINMNVSNVII